MVQEAFRSMVCRLIKKDTCTSFVQLIIGLVTLVAVVDMINVNRIILTVS